MKTYSISEASKLSGIQETMLRVWETRYGWPRAIRLENKYRMYTDIDISEMHLVKKALARGYRIGEIIRDGFVDYVDKTAPATNPLPKVEFNGLPAISESSMLVYKELTKHLELNNIPKAIQSIQSYGLVRPCDRKSAIIDPVNKWIKAANGSKKHESEIVELKNLILSVKI